MINKLFLLLPDHVDAETLTVSWYLSGDAKPSKKSKTEMDVSLKQGVGTLDEFSRLYHENFPEIEIAVILPGQYLTYTRVAVTVKNQRQMLQALPFLVEEQVIGNIEDMHIATPIKWSSDSIPLVIIDKTLLENIYTLFLGLNLSIKEIFGMPDLLAAEEGELQILLYNNVAFVKGDVHCFQCDQESIEAILESLSWDKITRIHISLHESDKQSLTIAKKIKLKLSSDDLEIKSTIFSGEVLAFILSGENLQKNIPINILQGNYSSSGGANAYFSQLMPLAWVALLCVLLQIGFNIASGLYFNRRAGLIESNANALYLKLFTDEKKVVSLASQLKVKLDASQLSVKKSNFSHIFSVTITAMNKLGNKNDTHLKQFRYDEESGELKIGLDTNAIAILDRLKQALGKQGFSVDIISANDDGGVIKATLSIKHV